MTTASVSRAIADYASSTTAAAVPADVRERAKLVIFDELCCAAFGRSRPAGTLAAKYAATQAGQPEAHVLGSDTYTSAPLAALVNGTSGHADEIDGAHVVGGHPGATLVHAAFALSEQKHAGGEELLNAVVLGYDIGVRMIAACGGTFTVKNVHHLHADFLHAIGAAVAGSRLLGLDANAYPHAMALATFQSNGLCMLFQEREHISKAFCNGQYAFAGVSAALMAAVGLEGADDFFGGEHGLLDAWGAPDGARLATEGLGRDYAIMQSNFKFVRAGYPIHAAVEAALSVLEAEGLAAETIGAVEVGMPEHALRVVDNRRMHNICLQDMLAVALINGGLDLSASYFPDVLADERFTRLRSRIKLRIDPELQAEQPNGRGSRVTITTVDDRTYSRRVNHPRGHSARGGATWADLAQKWRQALPTYDIDAIGATMQQLERIDDVRTLASYSATETGTSTMISLDYRRLHVVEEYHIVTAVIDNPPLNMLTPDLLDELDRLTTDVAADRDALVLVVKSADPDIFMTHAQFAGLYDLQPPSVPSSADEVELNRVQVICERLRTMNKVTIAQVEGRVAGGSAAMAMACDMRFGALGKAVFNTMSVPVGAVPGGGASQYMPRLIGYSRAMELILGGLDLDAATAERWGYINRALEPEQVEQFVNATARRIAACPPDAVRATKEVMAMSHGPIEVGLREEAFRFRRLFASEESRAYVNAFLELGGETRDGEQRIEQLLGEVLERMQRRTATSGPDATR